MAKKTTNINTPFVGMNRETFSHLQTDEKSFTFQKNGNLETDGESIALTNEHSTLLCSRFKPGFKVIGTKVDILNNTTYFFLVNPLTGCSEIGQIKHSLPITTLDDILADCNCKSQDNFQTPLEEQTQIPSCVYTPIFEECCDTPCLNFSIDHPIFDIVLKQEAVGQTLYFTDGLNPPRHLELDNIEQYYQNDLGCGEMEPLDCPSCEKLRIFNRFLKPCITPEKIVNGGNLRNGNYEFAIAYCDQLGNELSSYMSFTNPVHIFDENNIVLQQPTINANSSYGIRLDIKGLDTRYKFYKIVVIERTTVQGASEAFEFTMEPIENNSVLFVSNSDVQQKQGLDFNKITTVKPSYNVFNGLTSAGDYLIGYGVKTEEEWNLQPIANLMGEFVKWQTVITHEELYKNGVNDALFRGYMRDEVYPLGIRFVSNNGYTTRIFHLPGRVQTTNTSNSFGIDETAIASVISKSVQSVTGSSACADESRVYNWQFFNTATNEPGFCPNGGDLPTETIEQTTSYFCEITDDEDNEILVTSTPGTTYNLQNVADFNTLQEYIQSVLSNPCATDPTVPITVNSSCIAKRNNPDNPLFPIFQEILTYINDFDCVFPSPGDLDATSCDAWEYLDTSIEILNVVNEETIKTPSCDMDQYESPSRNSFCDTYQKEMNPENTGTQPIWDNSTSIGIARSQAIANSHLYIGPKIYKRTDATNITCSEALLIPSSNYSTFLGQVLQWRVVEHITGETRETQLQTNIPATIVSPSWTPAMAADWTLAVQDTIYFTDKIHKNASWFKYSFDPDKEDIVLRILPKGSCSDCSSSLYADNLENEDDNQYYRYHVMTSCSQHFEGLACNDDPTVLMSGIVTKAEAMAGVFLGVFLKADFPREEIYVVIDSPIHYYADDLRYTVFNLPTEFTIPFGSPSCELVCPNPGPGPSSLEYCEKNGNVYSCYYSTDIVERKETSAITPADGCYLVVAQDVIYSSVETSFDSLTYKADKEYETTCTYEIPVVNLGCDPVSYQKGRMAYWQSNVKYPNNHHLFDSSILSINESDIPLDYRPLFENAFVESNPSDAPYVLNQANTNLCDSAFIRHHKMPDNRTSSFTSTVFNNQDNLATIFPLGIHIDATIIRSLLEIAAKPENNLITQEQLESITHYEIFRGDRKLHKSVLFKGYAFDMYEDTSDRFSNKTILFKNFPFNTLGTNKFLTNTFDSTNDFVKHPDNINYVNQSYAIIAPEIYLDKSTIGSEINIEGYMFGKTSTVFDYVDGHSRWVILSPAAYNSASTLATMEVLLENVAKLSEFTIQASHNMWVEGGTIFGSGFVGYAVAIASVLAFAGTMVINTVTHYIQYKTQWLETFKNLGTPINFAKYSVGKKGHYNYFRKELDINESLRGIGTSLYLKPGKPTFYDTGLKKQVTVNNRDREDSYYLSFNEHGLKPDSYYAAYDNTDKNNSNASRQISGCGTNYYTNRNVASPYFSVKNYLPAQYGELGSISYLNTNKCLHIENDNECDPIFGGDIYITRTSLKNKFPLFHVNAVDLPDRTPFDYTLYPNVAWPFYYCQYDYNEFEEKSALGFNVPYATVHSKFRFQCQNQNKHYIVQPSHFYLFNYGIPYILTESELNTNFRYAGFEKHEKFAGSGAIDEEEWTQEKVVSIQMNNVFKYNQMYSESQSISSRDILPYNSYSPEYFKTLAFNPNAVVYSTIDLAERSLTDPFLTFKANDIKTYKAKYGKLISINPIESSIVLLRFENQCVVLNSVDVLKDRVTPKNKETGLSGIFAQNNGRDVTFMETPLGESGTQHRAFVSTPFGHYWVDAKRGKINKINSNGGGLSQISHFKQGNNSTSGMGKWFQKHLPFKILKKDFPGRDDVNLDNAFKDLGIIMWFDNKFNRIFITKKDYILTNDLVGYDKEIGWYLQQGEDRLPIQLKDYAKDASWTVAYSPIYDSFISYYDFFPNYALSYTNHFSTGINYSYNNDVLEEGVWSHLLTNKSFQVFYGKKYAWEIEYVEKNQLINKIASSISLHVMSHRYHGEYDIAELRKHSFNRALIYNNTNNSGWLELRYEDNYRKSKYPIQVDNLTQIIPVSHVDEKININYFFNRTRNQELNTPILLWNENETGFDLNPTAISFSGKKVLERIRGEWFKIKLVQDKSSLFKQIFKWAETSSNMYQ